MFAAIRTFLFGVPVAPLPVQAALEAQSVDINPHTSALALRAAYRLRNVLLALEQEKPDADSQRSKDLCDAVDLACAVLLTAGFRVSTPLDSLDAEALIESMT